MGDPAAVAAPPPERVRAAVLATYLAFVGAGFATASWASRIPQVRDHLHLSASQIGLVLLAVAAGSVTALPSTGLIVHRLGTRRTVTVMSLVLATGLLVTALGYLGGAVTGVVAGFVLIGFANGAWDVAMNVHGAHAERLVGRAIMPRFHAGYSVGTVAGALVGTAMVALHVSVPVHLLAAAVAIIAVVPLGVRSFVPDVAADVPERSGASGLPQPRRRSQALRRWTEPRTVLIGLFVLAFAFAEGAGNDWTSIALIDGHHVPAAVGTLGFATFLAAMTVARWFGPHLLERFGRVRTLRLLTLVSLAGLVVFVYAPPVPLAFLGAVLWGLGVSLGFPVGMSAASDDPGAAAARTSVVASIGYCAFLGGPPLIGFLGGHIGVLHALIVLAAPLAVAAFVAPVLRGPDRLRAPDSATAGT